MVNQFLAPLSGGLLIGLSAVLLLLLIGRIAGVSGIAWGAVSGAADNAWRWLFLLGLIGGGALYHWISGAPAPAPNPAGWPLAVAAGLTVGIGVRIGNGCTSGHGVCGLGFHSLRSLAATITFMATGIITVFIMRHVLGGAS